MTQQTPVLAYFHGKGPGLRAISDAGGDAMYWVQKGLLRGGYEPRWGAVGQDGGNGGADARPLARSPGNPGQFNSARPEPTILHVPRARRTRGTSLGTGI